MTDRQNESVPESPKDLFTGLTCTRSEMMRFKDFKELSGSPAKLAIFNKILLIIRGASNDPLAKMDKKAVKSALQNLAKFVNSFTEEQAIEKAKKSGDELAGEIPEVFHGAQANDPNASSKKKNKKESPKSDTTGNDGSKGDSKAESEKFSDRTQENSDPLDGLNLDGTGYDALTDSQREYFINAIRFARQTKKVSSEYFTPQILSELVKHVKGVGSSNGTSLDSSLTPTQRATTTVVNFNNGSSSPGPHPNPAGLGSPTTSSSPSPRPRPRLPNPTGLGSTNYNKLFTALGITAVATLSGAIVAGGVASYRGAYQGVLDAHTSPVNTDGGVTTFDMPQASRNSNTYIGGDFSVRRDGTYLILTNFGHNDPTKVIINNDTFNIGAPAPGTKEFALNIDGISEPLNVQVKYHDADTNSPAVSPIIVVQ